MTKGRKEPRRWSLCYEWRGGRALLLASLDWSTSEIGFDGLHEVFVGSWDSFTSARSVADDATAPDTFTDVEPEHYFNAHQRVQAELLCEKTLKRRSIGGKGAIHFDCQVTPGT